MYNFLPAVKGTALVQAAKTYVQGIFDIEIYTETCHRKHYYKRSKYRSWDCRYNLFHILQCR